jgi:fatty-acyl-CoA synthase
VQPGDAGQIQYTSGTTGAPKGAILHHRGIVNNARFIAEQMRVPDGAVWLNQMPLFHVAGSQINALGALAARAAQLITTFEPARMLALVEEERPYVMIGAPTMFLMILDHPDAARHDLSSLGVCAVGGSPRPVGLGPRFEEKTGCRWINFYGMTETCACRCRRSSTIHRPRALARLAARSPAARCASPIQGAAPRCPSVGSARSAYAAIR